MQNTYKTLSLIIPAYNEEKTVNRVLDVALQCKLVSEVVCVNDGSQDGTLGVLESYKNKIILVNLAVNRGKGAAMSAGVKKSTSELILFMDADLIGLNPSHIEKMYFHLINHEYDVVLGSMDYPKIWFSVMSLFAFGRFGRYGRENDEFTGERIYYRKDLLPHLVNMEPLRFGVETYLNKAFKDRKTGFVKLENLQHLPKHKKLGLNLRTVREIVAQFKSMSRA